MENFQRCLKMIKDTFGRMYSARLKIGTKVRLKVAYAWIKLLRGNDKVSYHENMSTYTA